MQSEAQRGFRQRDTTLYELPKRQVDKRQETRFMSMLNQEFGGRVACRKFIKTGRLENGKITRPKAVTLRAQPEKQMRRITNPESKKRKREKYYLKLQNDMTSLDPTLMARRKVTLTKLAHGWHKHNLDKIEKR